MCPTLPNLTDLAAMKAFALGKPANLPDGEANVY